jgi:hypothetical protein
MHRLARIALQTAVAAVAVLTLSLPATALALKVPPLDSISTALAPPSASTPEFKTVRGTLPVGTSLPATVAIPVPSGVKLSWVGEILGGDPSKDPTATYTVQRADGYDIVFVTVTKSLSAQAEMGLAPASSSQGLPATYSLSLPIPGRVKTVQLAFQLPTGSTVTSTSAGLASAPAPSGSVGYALSKLNPKVGSTVKAALTLVVAASPAAGSATSAGQSAGAPPATSSPSTTNALWGVLVAIASGFLLWNLYKLMRPAVAVDVPEDDEPEDNEQEDDEPDDDEPEGEPEDDQPEDDDPEDAEPSEQVTSEPSPTDGESAGASREDADSSSAESEDESPEDAVSSKPETSTTHAVTEPSSALADDDIVARLKTLADLHAAGELTDEEFSLAKMKLLGA